MTLATRPTGTVTVNLASGDTDIATLSAASLEFTPAVTLVLTPASIDEDGGTTSGVSTVTATLSGESSHAVTLAVAAAPGSGATASDYTLSDSTRLTIAAGSRTSTGTVPIRAIPTPTPKISPSRPATGNHPPPGRQRTLRHRIARLRRRTDRPYSILNNCRGLAG